MPQRSQARPRRIPEVAILELDKYLHVLRHVPLRRLQVDIGHQPKQVGDVRCRIVRGRDIGQQRKDVLILDRAEHGGQRLMKTSKGRRRAGSVPEDEGDGDEGSARANTSR